MSGTFIFNTDISLFREEASLKNML